MVKDNMLVFLFVRKWVCDMIDFAKYDLDYEVPLNPVNFVDFTNTTVDSNQIRSENYYMQSDAYLECADELAKWLYDNIGIANAFDYGVMLYLANHSVELKIKSFLIKINEHDIIGHDYVKLAEKIPDKYFYEIIDGAGKQALIDNIKSLNKYNTKQNELGRYTEDKNGMRIPRNKNDEVYVPLMSIMYIYHQIIDLLNANYKRISKGE